MLWAPLPLPAVAPNDVLRLASASAGSIARRHCVGFILACGKLGFEAFDSEERRSLGVYGTQREAAAAIMRGSP
jgi:hypothetical protein